MTTFTSRSERLLVHDEDHHRPALTVEERNRLGYWVLMRLYDTAGNDPARYADLLPEVDDFELRSAASWLVSNGYAIWAPNSSIAITDAGRQAVEGVAAER